MPSAIQSGICMWVMCNPLLRLTAIARSISIWCRKKLIVFINIANFINVINRQIPVNIPFLINNMLQTDKNLRFNSTIVSFDYRVLFHQMRKRQMRGIGNHWLGEKLKSRNDSWENARNKIKCWYNVSVFCCCCCHFRLIAIKHHNTIHNCMPNVHQAKKTTTKQLRYTIIMITMASWGIISCHRII